MKCRRKGGIDARSATAMAADCSQRMESVAETLLRLGEGQPAPQVEAVTAALDAARLARQVGDTDVCQSVVVGAETILSRAGMAADSPQQAGKP